MSSPLSPPGTVGCMVSTYTTNTPAPTCWPRRVWCGALQLECTRLCLCAAAVHIHAHQRCMFACASLRQSPGRRKRVGERESARERESESAGERESNRAREWARKADRERELEGKRARARAQARARGSARERAGERESESEREGEERERGERERERACARARGRESARAHVFRHARLRPGMCACMRRPRRATFEPGIPRVRVRRVHRDACGCRYPSRMRTRTH